MSLNKRKKVLVAIDGSERGLRTVRYVSKFGPFRDMQINLFHVFSSVPESYWDLEKEPNSSKAMIHVRAWQLEQRKEIQRYMQAARKILVQAGFAEDSVTAHIHDRKKGVARDIISEALNGYDLVVTRRRGFTAIRGITIGSVAAKLLDKLTFVPVAVAGRKPSNQRVLIALDGSDSARRALDFAGTALGGRDFEVGLMNVIRGEQKPASRIRPLFLPAAFREEKQKDMTMEFQRAKDHLAGIGFKPHRIKTYSVVGTRSRGASIAETAKQQNYSLIVMGRRGLSGPEEFSMGRVPRKVIQLATASAIWIIP